jgi:hypothetical protein
VLYAEDVSKVHNLSRYFIGNKSENSVNYYKLLLNKWLRLFFGREINFLKNPDCPNGKIAPGVVRIDVTPYFSLWGIVVSAYFTLVELM